MAANSSKQLSSACIHPSSAYHRDFFLLRLPTFINGQPTEIRGPDTHPLLYSSELDSSIDLPAVTKEVSLILGSNDVSFIRSFYDKGFLLFEIEFPPPVTCECIDSFLTKASSLCPEVGGIFEAHFRSATSEAAPFQVEVIVELYLCSPSKDGKTPSYVTAINARGNQGQHIGVYLESQMFKFSEMFESNPCKDNETKVEATLHELIHDLLQATDVWFTLGALLEVPSYKLTTWRDQCPHSPETCLTYMMMWLLDNREFTWVKVTEALGKVGKQELARKLCEKHGIQRPTEEKVKPQNLEEEEEKQQQSRLQEHISIAKADTDVVHEDTERIIKEDYPALKKEMEELIREKRYIEEELEREHSQCNQLHESKNHHMNKIKELQTSLQEKKALIKKYADRIRTIENQIQEKEHTIVTLSCKLGETEHKYEQTKQQMTMLVEKLSSKTAELVEKSSILATLQESLVESEVDVVQQAVKRIKEDEAMQKAAKNKSQGTYIAEIERQLLCEEQEVEIIENEIESLKSEHSKLEEEISGVMEKIHLKEQAQQLKLQSNENGDSGEVLVEQQIEVANLNIELVDLRLQCNQAKIRFMSSQHILCQRKKSIEAKKQHVPDLSKCQIEGLEIPLHKTKKNTAIRFKVHLCDRDGEPCTGEHVVTARETSGSQELIVTEPDAECSTYTLTYTPRIPGEHSFSVFINDVPLNSEPLYTLVYNTPHLPNCTVSGEGLNNASQNFVASVKVNLVDEDGGPVAAEQTVSASLSQEEGDCLVLPPDVATTETPGVYVVSYLPGRSGVCELTVLVNGKPIGGGPFSVDVAKTVVTPLTGAASSGHQRFLLALLDKGADVNERDRKGDTALYWASCKGHKDIVELLVQKGAQVDSKNNGGNTALHEASCEGHGDTVELLLLKGAQVDSQNNDGHTALHWASYKGHKDTVELLVQKGAQVDSKNKNGYTALHWASYNGHKDTVELLVQKGAQVDSKNNSSQTALDVAGLFGHTEVCKILQSYK